MKDKDAIRKYWLIVASKDHVMIGVKEGICMSNHGKKAPLMRMKKGDGVVFYSPKVSFVGKEKLRKFTAIGRIKDDDVYQVEMANGWKPYRRRVEFYPSKEADIEPLIPFLSFIKDKKSWGSVFRFGLLQIPEEDFIRIENAMTT